MVNGLLIETVSRGAGAGSEGPNWERGCCRCRQLVAAGGASNKAGASSKAGGLNGTYGRSASWGREGRTGIQTLDALPAVSQILTYVSV